MRKIIYFKQDFSSFCGFNLFYRCEYEDIEIPGGIFRIIYCPAFKNNKSEKRFLKHIAPLLTDGALLKSECEFESLSIPKIPESMADTINKNIEKLVLSVCKDTSVNIVIKDETYFSYLSPLIPHIQLNIISEGGNKEYISEHLLDEYGISMNIKGHLKMADMKGRLSVFMPGTMPPASCGENAVLNFSERECMGSLTENSILYRIPGGFEKLQKILDNNTKKIFAVLEYLGFKTESISMVVQPGSISPVRAT